MKKKVLVCGATGFIGRNIATALAENEEYEVFGTYLKSEPFQHPKVEMIQADLTQASDVNRVVQGMDIIVQAAATTSGAKDIVNRPYIHVTDNAVMNSLLFRAAYEHKIQQVVFFSCTVMYPNSDRPLLESDFDANQEMYPKYFGVGWTKVYVEKMAEFYSRIGKTKYTVIRHSNIYGPHDKYDLDRSHVFGATVTKILTNTDGRIVVWGKGEEKRDLLYISDLVQFVEAALQKQNDPYRLVNVGYGEAFSVRELVEKIIHHSGKKLEMVFDSTKPSLDTKLCLDISQAHSVFEWKPQISLDEGIQKTLKWYRENLPHV